MSQTATATKNPRSGKEYKTWSRMILRCHDEGDPRYPWYGARGIAVCDRWRGSYDLFLADMGPAPTAGHTIERQDNDGGYHPENCVWATWKEQARNRRGNVKLTFMGETLTMAEWAERGCMDRRVLHKRLSAGWELARALTQVLAPRRKNVPSKARAA